MVVWQHTILQVVRLEFPLWKIKYFGNIVVVLEFGDGWLLDSLVAEGGVK